jgi:threonine dehydrogenase-like Zn-dependent dehydrogenase
MSEVPGGRMKALQFTAINEVDLVEIDIPTPGPREVLIRTGATTICTSDIQDIRDNAFDAELPLILGHEGAGTVVGIGSEVTQVAVGDRVAAHPVHPCLTCETCLDGMGHLCPNMLHFGLSIQGTFAEYFPAREDRVRQLPDQVPFSTAALAEPVCVCLEAIYQARLTPGDHLLIIGDGPFGVLMARLALRDGTGPVSIAGRHPSRLAFAQLARQIHTPAGADTRQILRDASEDRGYDAVILAASNRAAVDDALHLLRPGGRLVIFAPMPGSTPVDLFQVLVRELEIIGAVNDRDRFDDAIAALADPAIGIGDLVTHTFTLDDYRKALRVAEHDRQQAMKVAFQFEAAQGTQQA